MFMIVVTLRFEQPYLFQDVTKSMIPYWQRDRMRVELKGLKKKMDDLDKARKANILSEVVEEAKQMIEKSPNQKYVVHTFSAGSNGKVNELFNPFPNNKF